MASSSDGRPRARRRSLAARLRAMRSPTRSSEFDLPSGSMRGAICQVRRRASCRTASTSTEVANGRRLSRITRSAPASHRAKASASPKPMSGRKASRSSICRSRTSHASARRRLRMSPKRWPGCPLIAIARRTLARGVTWTAAVERSDKTVGSRGRAVVPSDVDFDRQVPLRGLADQELENDGPSVAVSHAPARELRGGLPAALCPRGGWRSVQAH